MQTTSASPVTQGNNSSYRIQHWHTGRCIRLHCAPASALEAPQIVAKRCSPQQATHFLSDEAAADAAARYMPNQPVEIVRVDA